MGVPRMDDALMDGIEIYTRARQIEDGILIDISNHADDAGFVCPVAATIGVWQKFIEPHEDSDARLRDILLKAALAVAELQSRGIPSERLYLHNEEGRVLMYAQCSPGDTGEAVMTIMLPNEDY